MKLPELELRTLETSVPLDSAAFGLSEDIEDLAGILRLLRDKIYTNKPLAVVREYATNAWDAHVEAGCPEKPIRVVLPSYLEPTLIIQDWGPGLSRDGVLKHYTKFGKSGKRHTNNQVGTLGLGCKAAHAYSDQFNIISCHGGKKSVYSASIDSTYIGRCDLMHEEDIDPAMTGMEIRVPVRASDIGRFVAEASYVLSFFRPLPDLVGASFTETLPQKLEEPGFLYTKEAPSRGAWTAVMGCVPYKIELSSVLKKSEEDTFGLSQSLYDQVSKMRGLLVFPIGAIDMAGSREEVDYTDKTRKAISEGVSRVLDLHIQSIRALLGEAKGWARRQEILKLRHEYGASLSDLKLTENVKLGRPHTFKPMFRQTHTNRRRREVVEWVDRVEWITDASGVRVASPDMDFNPEKTTLYIRDTPRVLEHYEAIRAGIVLQPLANYTPEDVAKELEQLLTDAGIEGFPYKKISSIAIDEEKLAKKQKEQEDKQARKRLLSEKYKGRVFLFNGKFTPDRYSDAWTLVADVPGDEDLVVPLRSFKPNGSKHFLNNLRDLMLVLTPFGVSLPKLYGLRVTTKQPLPEEMPGLDFAEWQKEQLQRLAQKHSMGLALARLSRQFPYSSTHRKDLRRLAHLLGPDHPVVEYYRLLHASKHSKMERSRLLYARLERAEVLDELDLPSLKPAWKKLYPFLDRGRMPSEAECARIREVDALALIEAGEREAFQKKRLRRLEEKSRKERGRQRKEALLEKAVLDGLLAASGPPDPETLESLECK